MLDSERHTAYSGDLLGQEDSDGVDSKVPEGED